MLSVLNLVGTCTAIPVPVIGAVARRNFGKFRVYWKLICISISFQFLVNLAQVSFRDRYTYATNLLTYSTYKVLNFITTNAMNLVF